MNIQSNAQRKKIFTQILFSLANISRESQWLFTRSDFLLDDCTSIFDVLNWRNKEGYMDYVAKSSSCAPSLNETTGSVPICVCYNDQCKRVWNVRCAAADEKRTLHCNTRGSPWKKSSLVFSSICTSGISKMEASARKTRSPRG